MADRNRATRILCVNCNVCINKLRRYPALALDTRVTALLCSWAYPQIITEGDYVCETCRDLAMSAINDSLLRELSDGSEVAGPSSNRRNISVCLLCGISIVYRQSDKILRPNPSEMYQSMVRIIEGRVAPRQVTETDRVCHACWLRTKREFQRNTLQDVGRERDQPEEIVQEEASQFVEEESEQVQEETSQSSSSTISLPDYRRAANSSHHCVFPDCNATSLRSISDNLRAIILNNFKYYIPKLARVCNEHLLSNSWEMLYSSTNSIAQFCADHVQHVFSFVNSFNPTLDFENVQEMDDIIFEYWTGFTKEKFNNLLSEVPHITELSRGILGLAAYRIKMRNGDSDERIATLVRVPRRTLEPIMAKVRNILLEDFVPQNLGINHLTREELLRHRLIIPSGLYGSANTAIVICDGTYIYIHKSANYRFQKETYSLHKYRNLLKPFLMVACDGYIVDCFGPYKATTTDAEIMNGLFRNENSDLRFYFQNGDVFILDRGFRDSIQLLEECGYKPYMPESLLEGEHQLTTEQANRSRCVTICRWVVEVINGHFKRDFKIFRQEYCHLSLPQMMENFRIAAAILNKFGVRFTNNVYAVDILRTISERINLENNLADMVQNENMNRRTSYFTNITAVRNNLLYFPVLDYRNLITISLGSYQIRQARSYYGEHVRVHGGYVIEVTSERFNSSEYNLRGSGDTTLIRGKIKSRHISRKTYYVYILIENNVSGREGIVEYCCNCLVGRRTIGCCSHTMTIIWYLGWARHQQNISAPAEFLDEIVIRDEDEE